VNEAELLFTEVLNCDRLSLFLNKGSCLDKDKSAYIASVLKRRSAGEPIQYILGKAEFMGLEFKVNKDTLIPRPETEILVEETLEAAREFLMPPRDRGLNMLDMGTGSGCIAVSLAKLMPKVKIDAVDISEKALKTAGENARSNSVIENIKFIQSDLFTNRRLRFMNYDMIISNPPYVATAEIGDLQPEIKHEPVISLDGGKRGLDFYRRIIAEAPDYLKDGGFLIMEMGFKQKDSIKEIFQKSGYFEIIRIAKDYNNIDRVITARIINRNG